MEPGEGRMRRGVLRLAGGIVLAGVLLAALLSPVVLGGGLVAGKVAATAARISPASLAGQTPLVTTVTDRNGTPIATRWRCRRRRLVRRLCLLGWLPR
jgi:hypothetical protein